MPRSSPGFLEKLFGAKPHPHQAPTPESRVTPDASRCVQCGVCGHNCPVGIPVRDYARLGKPVEAVDCVQCGQCIDVCPRGTLRWATPQSAPAAAPPGIEALLDGYLQATRRPPP